MDYSNFKITEIRFYHQNSLNKFSVDILVNDKYLIQYDSHTRSYDSCIHGDDVHYEYTQIIIPPWFKNLCPIKCRKDQRDFHNFFCDKELNKNSCEDIKNLLENLGIDELRNNELTFYELGKILDPINKSINKIQ